MPNGPVPAVIALAGRRIDAPDTYPPRFPRDAITSVHRRIAALLRDENAVALVCSAACGADLVALDEAEQFGLRVRIILPFAVQSFLESSVNDRPGKWQPIFDRMIEAAQRRGDLIVLAGKPEDGDAAYAAANAAIIEQAEALAKDAGAHRRVSAIVWDGTAREGNDLTARFRQSAIQAGFEDRVVLTCPVIDEAKDYLRGSNLSPDQVLALVNRLKEEDRFGWARQVIGKVRKTQIDRAELRDKFARQHALCTYKDSDMPVLVALDRAMEILGGHFDLSTTRDQEVLGLAGAIFKRRWQATGQKDQLERSYRFYRRGFEVGPEIDKGYTAINAAFVLDQLAEIEAANEAPSVDERRAEAQKIREAIEAQLVPMRSNNPDLDREWWYLVTVAEALFGLRKYDDAKTWLTRAKSVRGTPDWEFRSTATQLATLAQLQQKGTPSPDSPEVLKASAVLDDFLELKVASKSNAAKSPAARESAFIGKVGLALSGGGFRASLFHIGVLARMAELDVLRRVEVLSCVSGGSIIGAHYYLALREMMMTTKLDELEPEKIREKYVELVRQVATDFLAGVQTNIRMRVFANPAALLRSIFSRAYTRTVRLGELFESQLFDKIGVKTEQPGTPLLLKELRIIPADAEEGFDPKIHNWRRAAKVPMLILNATTLNTGHAWQYTVSYMGESPWAIDPNADGTNRLRRMYHNEAPPAHRNTPLSQAVVASACVPGLFEPIRLDGLYRLEQRGKKAEPLVLRQVDGGVHDNQGIAGLFEQGCSVVLVSDASGQTDVAIDPGGGTVAPLMRSNSVLMERVRQEQYTRLDTLEKRGLLKGAMFIHLKKDLDVVPLDWIGCEEPHEPRATIGEPRTSYNIRKEVQQLLAGIRTDLDSFSDVEAFALMTSGYRMTDHYLSKVQVLPQATQAPGHWNFLAIESIMNDARTSDPNYQRLLGLLGSGGKLMFRVWSQSRVLLLSTGLLAMFGVVAAGIWLFGLFTSGANETPLTIDRRTILGAVIAVVVMAVLLAVPIIREHVTRIAVGVLTLVLCVPARLHLWLVDGFFLKLGRLSRLGLKADDTR
ncbi:hypothetical protein CVM73_20715 [Bradyrhizobium forestalis]|uniref:PNPLA domain-containing protein n=1 Tax=Bradyrhizobium forestalis TaxID=1419263 RepID=A0A2M8R669_9BRAD|nr:patatin-like phospholipase family protein [Bradyrhizobium forestalis]PJG53332.1 hypothetical protein CVM73_20715 [Bradyrhizobium forestalis]